MVDALDDGLEVREGLGGLLEHAAFDELARRRVDAQLRGDVVVVRERHGLRAQRAFRRVFDIARQYDIVTHGSTFLPTPIGHYVRRLVFPCPAMQSFCMQRIRRYGGMRCQHISENRCETYRAPSRAYRLGHDREYVEKRKRAAGATSRSASPARTTRRRLRRMRRDAARKRARHGEPALETGRTPPCLGMAAVRRCGGAAVRRCGGAAKA